MYKHHIESLEILFECNRRLEEQVQKITGKTAGLVVLGKKLALSQSEEDTDVFVEKFKEISTYKPPEDIASILSVYTRDYEEWWHIKGPFINEW